MTGPCPLLTRAASAAALLLVSLCAACGGGGGTDESLLGGGNAIAQGLVLRQPGLPPASVGTPYGPVRLDVEEAAGGRLTWRLWSGSLPEGLSLGTDGVIRGTPRAPGVAVFSVHVRDGDRAGVATRAVAVDAFGLYARSGLLHGEAWSGHPVRLQAAGAEGIVSFHILHDASGGRLTQVDVERGSAVWVPGGRSTSLGFARDMIEAIDEATGRAHRVTIDVRSDPMREHEADFASTDVWYVNTALKTGSHAYAYDFHHALAEVGLRGRDVSSLDALGRCVDMLAAQCVRLELLRELDRHFLRDRAAHLALPVSFPYHEPGEGFAKPAPGTYAAGAPGRYNEIGLLHGPRHGTLGTAFLDGAHNEQVENDTSAGEQTLGVFLDATLPYYTRYYRSTLETRPIDDGDLDALHAILHGLGDVGGRYQAILQRIRSFARVLAIITAHEIGHSLGLHHAPPEAHDSLMSAHAQIRPWDAPRFTPDELAFLRACLPGTGRGFGHAPQALVGGGIVHGAASCPRGTCHLHPPVGVTLPRRPAATRAP